MEWLALPIRKFQPTVKLRYSMDRRSLRQRRGQEDARQRVPSGTSTLIRVERGMSPRRAQSDKQLGRQFAHPYHFEPSDAPRAEEHVPSGTVRVQVSSS